jgi:predicted MFS family arabinose efflux permease
VAVAATPGVFVAAVFVGGLGAGFASPAMVRVVDAAVSDSMAPTAQALVNTGTAFGVVGAGALAFAVTSTSAAWLLMAGVCAASAAGVLLGWRSGLSTAPAGDAAPPSGGPGRPGALTVPATAAVVVGAGSAVIWTFGPTLATEAGSVPAAHVGWLWIALGVGGLAGPSTGAVVSRLGPAGGWRLCAGVLALSYLVLVAALVLGTPWPAYVAMAVFGAGYLCLTGVLILWARAVRPAGSGAATAVLFIALAVGQALGSLALGAARAPLGPTGVVVAAALLCALGGTLARVRRVPSPAT